MLNPPFTPVLVLTLCTISLPIWSPGSPENPITGANPQQCSLRARCYSSLRETQAGLNNSGTAGPVLQPAQSYRGPCIKINWCVFSLSPLILLPLSSAVKYGLRHWQASELFLQWRSSREPYMTPQAKHMCRRGERERTLQICLILKTALNE